MFLEHLLCRSEFGENSQGWHDPYPKPPPRPLDQNLSHRFERLNLLMSVMY